MHTQPLLTQPTPHHVHLWITRTADAHNPDLLSRYLSLLNPSEKDQYHRFLRDADRHRYLITRALVRTVLSRYLPGHPADWQFTAGERGRPELVQPHAPNPLRFNLSHTQAFVILAITTTHDIGVDIESTTRRCDMQNIARHFFSPTEQADLIHLEANNPELLRTHFFFIWTLKEAYIKARGQGLALPLADFSFQLDAQNHIHTTFAPSLSDSEQDWQFYAFHTNIDHAIALAVRTPHPPTLTFHTTLPLVSEQQFPHTANPHTHQPLHIP